MSPPVAKAPAAASAGRERPPGIAPTCDAIGALQVSLLDGRAWPAQSAGEQDLLHASGPRSRPSARKRDAWQRMLSDRIRRSAVCVHNSNSGWQDALRRTISGLNALHSVAIICRTSGRRESLLNLIDCFRQEELQLSDFGIESGPEGQGGDQILTLDQLQPGIGFQEVFLAEDINEATTTCFELANLCAFAQVGLHMIGSNRRSE